ncbi:hypothetical protein GVX86_06445 [[Haemophilus] felis]|nr:hypothetical protein [[Haemophilus] felis]
MGMLISVVGILALLAIAFALSNNRKAINYRTVLGALGIQIAIGALILYVPVGREALLWLSNGVSKVIAYGNEGIGFLFGGLVSDKMFEVFGGGGFVFALRVLPTIVFFSALISLLYYIGVMQWIIKIIGGALQKLLGTSRAESMSAAANIFVGQTQAIITFALCGFANFSSIAILIGGLGTMAPNRRGDIARLGIKAMIAGSLANLMSATIAGLFIGLGGVALG